MNHTKQITPALSQIKTGTPGYKIGDQYLVGGIGGNFIPGGQSSDVILGQIVSGKFVPQVFDGTTATAGQSQSFSQVYTYNTAQPAAGGGSSTEYYKCASVDTSTNTWTGYKASIDSTTGEWTFASDSTEGLTYGSHLTPVVGNVYDSACSYKCVDYYTGIPSGCVFFLPLVSSFADTITDRTPTTSSGTFTTFDNKPCVHFVSGNYAKYSGFSDLPSGTSAMSIYMDVGFTATPSSWIHEFGFYGTSTANMFGMSGYQTDASARIGEDWNPAGGVWLLNAWNKVCLTRSDAGEIKWYFNGELYATKTKSYSVGSAWICLGSLTSEGDGAHTGDQYLRNCMIFNRELTAAEVAQLETL